ncbi:MAG: energy transducer TonB [Saprospiraceae bacterium]
MVLEFPEIARKSNIQGIVEVGLVISKNCEIEEINITKFLGADCDKTVLKAIRLLAELIKKYDTTRCTGIRQIIPVHFKIE